MILWPVGEPNTEYFAFFPERDQGSLVWYLAVITGERQGVIIEVLSFGSSAAYLFAPFLILLGLKQFLFPENSAYAIRSPFLDTPTPTVLGTVLRLLLFIPVVTCSCFLDFTFYEHKF